MLQKFRGISRMLSGGARSPASTPGMDYKKMPILVYLISLLINVYIGLLIVGAVLSWFIHDPSNPLIRTIDRFTDPILNPIRRALGMTGPVDFSPLVAILALSLLRRLLVGLL